MVGPAFDRPNVVNNPDTVKTEEYPPIGHVHAVSYYKPLKPQMSRIKLQIQAQLWLLLGTQINTLATLLDEFNAHTYTQKCGYRVHFALAWVIKTIGLSVQLCAIIRLLVMLIFTYAHTIKMSCRFLFPAKIDVYIRKCDTNTCPTEQCLQLPTLSFCNTKQIQFKSYSYTCLPQQSDR